MNDDHSLGNAPQLPNPPEHPANPGPEESGLPYSDLATRADAPTAEPTIQNAPPASTAHGVQGEVVHDTPTEPAMPFAPWQPAGSPPAYPAGQWAAGAPGYPANVPPYYPYATASGARRPRRRPWLGIVVALLLLALAGGFGLGRVSGAGSVLGATTLGTQAAPAVSVSSNVTSLQQTVEKVAAAVEPSVVEITSIGNGQEGIGSGDILTSNGYIVTNDHVVAGFTSYTVTLANGTRLAAQVVGEDPSNDLAVIKVNASNLTPIAFADSSKLTVGQFAVAVGNPYGLRETATFGTVSATNRTASESPDGPAAYLTGLVQTSAPIAPGNSGGALVNLQGQLIGIPTLGQSTKQPGASASTSTIGFAIPSNTVKSDSQQLMQRGHVTSTGQGFLGIQGQDVSPALAAANGLSVQSGVLIAGFASDTAGQSPAQQAGLQVGDVIIAINGQTINNSADLAAVDAGQAPGTHLRVTYVRGSSQQTVTLTLGERPANAQG